MRNDERTIQTMKKTISIFLACTLSLCIALADPAFAYNYNFSTGEDTLPGFGRATGYDDPVSPDPMSENVRRNKDAAYLPPPYFYGSGEIPTDQLIIDNGEWIMRETYGTQVSSAEYVPSLSTINSQLSINEAPLYYADGSIGTLYVAKTGKTIKVYEGEQLANLKKGAGHFAMTSAWDGNVGLCGHNRGSWPFFSFVKDLKIGDKLTYTTRYGTRTYEVISVERISEYDYSTLGWSVGNLLSLITCIANTPELRYAALCKQV